MIPYFSSIGGPFMVCPFAPSLGEAMLNTQKRNLWCDSKSPSSHTIGFCSNFCALRLCYENEGCRH